MYRFLVIFLLLITAPGCVVIQTGVTNPIPNAPTVAVVPFFNQSMERSVNGRRFAEIYQEELQKIPGFQVVPVGRTETELISRGMTLKSPADAIELARLMNVDMVVVGSITDYDPYYPPRIGLHIAWYSHKPLDFSPGVQVDPYARRHFKLTDEVKHQAADDFYPAETKGWNRVRKVGRVTGISHFTRAFGSFRRGMWHYIKGEDTIIFEEPGMQQPVPMTPVPDQNMTPVVEELEIRSQSPDLPKENVQANQSRTVSPILGPPETSSTESTEEYSADTVLPLEEGQLIVSQQYCDDNCPENCPQHYHIHREHHLHFPDLTKYPGVIAAEPYKPFLEFDPMIPVMSYTKMFDSRDADVVANLRDYCELNNDLRSGGWKAYLDRSEDYIRFVSHRMIVEMLTLHGGEGKRRFVLKKRKYH